MKLNFKDLFALLKQTFAEWNEDKAPALGAALAYYTVFSLAPLLIIAIGIAALFLGQEAAQGQIFEQVRQLLGDKGGGAVEEIVQSSSQNRSGGIIATSIGLATLMFGASGVFGQLQTSLNTIWGVKPAPDRGIVGTLRDRFLSFGFILVVGFLLLVSLILTAGIAFVGEWFGNFVIGAEILSQVLNLVLSLGIIGLLFSMIFKYLPDVKIAWRDVWSGAFMTALLFIIGKTVLGIYLGKGTVDSAFGAGGSLIILLVWVYYSAQILFFGAEFTQVYANKYGSLVVPARGAIPIDENPPKAEKAVNAA
jgi:membrane protein